MTKARIELDESKMDSPEKETPKKQRRVSVKNPSFFLYKEDKESKELIPMGSFDTKSGIHSAYETALDNGSSEGELVGFKGRFLKFEVKETKRKIRVD